MVVGDELLAVSSFYPGLELATNGVHWLTGLPLVGAQILVVLLSGPLGMSVLSPIGEGPPQARPPGIGAGTPPGSTSGRLMAT